MKIVTWNINGVKARLEAALAYLRETKPDVIGFQEIKSVDEAFPREAFEELGYRVETFGQKGFNGVALLSRLPLEDVIRGLPGDEADQQSRYIEGTVIGPNGAVRVVNLYLPNGNPIGTDKFAYKLAWMARLNRRAAELLSFETPLVIMGDYNVIPDPIDAKRPAVWTGDALFQPESRRAYRTLLNLGFSDAIRLCHPEAGHYTFWDYQAGAWQKDDGIRIDHLLLSPEALDRLEGSGIDRHTRSWEKPSDHAPAWVDLS